MFTRVALGTCRYACAFALGLLCNALLFNVLWNVTSVRSEPEVVVATRIAFTRLRRDTETVSGRDSAKPQLQVINAPALPQLELAQVAASWNAPLLVEPAVDMRAALEKAGGAMGYDADVIAIVRIPPSYPRPARLARIQGYVTMEVLISPEGLVTDVSVVEAAPPRMFEIAAMDAMKRWRFRPRLVNGVAVGQRAHQTIEFKIEEG